MKYQGELRVTFEAMNQVLADMHPPGVAGKEAMHTFTASDPGTLVGYQDDLFTHVPYTAHRIAQYLIEHYLNESAEGVGIKNVWVDPKKEMVHLMIYTTDEGHSLLFRRAAEGQESPILLSLTTSDMTFPV